MALGMLFGISTITTIAYFTKLYLSMKVTTDNYYLMGKLEDMTKLTKNMIILNIFTMIMTPMQIMTSHMGRVCIGWNITSVRNQKGSGYLIDNSIYYINKGRFVTMMGLLGLSACVGMFLFHRLQKRRLAEIKTRQIILDARSEC